MSRPSPLSPSPLPRGSPKYTHRVPPRLAPEVDRLQLAALVLLRIEARKIVDRVHPRETDTWRGRTARKLADKYAVTHWQFTHRRLRDLRGLTGRGSSGLLPEVVELMGALRESIGDDR